MRKGRVIAGGCLVALIALFIVDCVLVVAIPGLGAIEKNTLKSLVSPPKPPPFRTSPLRASVTRWQGKLYANGSNDSTVVYDPATGAMLSTFPGVVAGSDDHLLYTANSAASIEGYFPPGAPTSVLPLVARSSSGASVWTYSAGSQGIVQMQSDGNVVYLLLRTLGVPSMSRLVALSANNGSLVWSYASPTEARQFIIAHNTLYLLNREAVIAFSASDGHQIWQRPVGANSIIGDEERLYVFGSQQILVVLSAQSGAMLWNETYQLATTGVSVLIDSGVVYFKDLNSQITARRAHDGHSLWNSGTPAGANRSLLAAHGQNLYMFENDPTSAPGGKLVALSGDTGQQTWTTKLLALSADKISLIGAEQGNLYFSNAVGYNEVSGLSTQFVALSESSGALLWQRDVPVVGGAALLSGQSLYVSTVLHHRRVSGAEFSRRVTDCADITSLYSLSATSGAIQSQRTQSFPCIRDSYY